MRHCSCYFEFSDKFRSDEHTLRASCWVVANAREAGRCSSEAKEARWGDWYGGARGLLVDWDRRSQRTSDDNDSVRLSFDPRGATFEANFFVFTPFYFHNSDFLRNTTFSYSCKTLHISQSSFWKERGRKIWKVPLLGIRTNECIFNKISNPKENISKEFIYVYVYCILWYGCVMRNDGVVKYIRD